VQKVNQELCRIIGGEKAAWATQSMDLMFPLASRIFLQTHVWPMVLREQQVREIRLQLLTSQGQKLPIFVNCQKTTQDGVDHFIWVLFVSLERSRYEQELLELKQRAEVVAAELTSSERFIRTASDALPSLMAYWDTQLICRFANKSYVEWYGKAPTEIVGVPMLAIIGERLFQQNQSVIAQALAGQAQQFERTVTKIDGSVVHTLVDYVPDIDAKGVVKGFFALVTNITRLREADVAIRLSASVFEATNEGILVTDTSAQIVSVNPAFSALTGYSADEVIGQNARLLKSGRHETAFFTEMFQKLSRDKLWKGEVWSKRKDGTIYLQQMSISALCDEGGQVVRYVGLCSDITEKWDKEQVIRHMALHDGLTGLPNRALLMERLGQLIAMARRDSRQIALMFLDLDGFKKVNDTLGHAIGDQVLKTVAARLLGLLRASDTVARFGGDEFVVLLDNPESHDSIAMVGTRMIDVLNVPMQLGCSSAQVGTSIGIAVFQDSIDSAESLLKRADEAMYAAKAVGKNVCRFATSS